MLDQQLAKSVNRRLRQLIRDPDALDNGAESWGEAGHSDAHSCIMPLDPAAARVLPGARSRAFTPIFGGFMPLKRRSIGMIWARCPPDPILQQQLSAALGHVPSSNNIEQE